MRILLRILLLCGFITLYLNGEKSRTVYAQQDINIIETPKLILDQERLILLVGEKQQIKLAIEGIYSGTVTYISGNSDVISIDQDGIVCGLKEGEGDLTVSLDTGETKTIHAVVVTDIAEITVMYLEDDNQVTLAEKQSRGLCTKVELSDRLKNELDTELVYTSMDSNVAAVDDKGIITGKKAGRTQITIQLKCDARVMYILEVTITNRKAGSVLSGKQLNIVGVKHAKYTYKEMKGDLKKLEELYGDRIQVDSLGQSYDKREIYLVRLGNPKAKCKILVQGAIHGREYMTAQLIMKQIEYYCKNYYTGLYKDKYLSELFDDNELYIVPMMNPDGVTISQFGASGIQNKKLRKKIMGICKKEGGEKKADYYSRWKANARGVDLNRNFNNYWADFNDKRSGPASKEYKGKTVESEKETQIIVKLYQQLKPSITLSYHASGGVIYWDFGQKGKLWDKSKDLRNLVKKLTGYTTLLNKNSKVKTPGFGDWVVRKKKAVNLTLEIGSKVCPLKSSAFDKIWGKNKLVYLVLAKYMNNK